MRVFNPILHTSSEFRSDGQMKRTWTGAAIALLEDNLNENAAILKRLLESELDFIRSKASITKYRSNNYFHNKSDQNWYLNIRDAKRAERVMWV